MSMSRAFLVLLAASALAACSTNDFVASWRAPDAQPLEVRTNTIVQVETLVYSLRQNKLVWGGQSQLTNPASIDRTIERLAASAAAELHKQGLLR